MENKSKQINDWFDSGEYKTDIDKLRTEIMSDSANSNSEATTASIFEKELYYLIKSKTGLKLDITKEQTLDGINHKFGNLTNRKSGNGRLDAVVNNLIIEYKHSIFWQFRISPVFFRWYPRPNPQHIRIYDRNLKLRQLPY